MIVSLVLAISAIEPINEIAEKCALAHETQDRARVVVNVDTVALYNSEHTVYDLAYDRKGSADLSIKRARPFRVVVSGNNVIEFDPTTRQYTEKTKGDEDIDVSIRHAAGTLDELVASLMTPKGIRLWLKSLRLSNLWKYELRDGMLVVSNHLAEDGTSLAMDPKTHLLSRVAIKSSKYGTVWRFKFSKPGEIAFVPPKDAFKVGELSPEFVPPVYSSAQAKKACERIFARYDHPRGLAYTVETDGEAFEVWIDRGRARQRDKHADWVLDDKTFKIALSNARSFATGPTNMAQVSDSVSVAGTRVEPLLKLALRGINPFRLYMGRNAVVAWTGRTKVNGEQCSILQSDSLDSKMSIVARDNDGFVLSVMSIPKGSDNTTMRRFRPVKVTTNSFKILKPSGWSVHTVEEIAKQAKKS